VFDAGIGRSTKRRAPVSDSLAGVVFAWVYSSELLLEPVILLLLGSALLPTTAMNLVYCRLCEGIRIRWAILWPVAICLSCIGIGFFDCLVVLREISFSHFDFVLHLATLLITVGVNLVMCRFCKGIQTDWPIVLLIGGVLIYLGVAFLRAF
jgi:hypothetical protein